MEIMSDETDGEATADTIPQPPATEPRKMSQIRPTGRPPGRPRKIPPMPAPSTQPSNDVALDGSAQVDTSVLEAPADVIPDRARGKAKLPMTPALQEMRRREDQAVSDWLTTLKSTGGAFKFQIVRTRPSTWMGKNTKGLLDTTIDMVSEEDIATQWGGGSYELRVQKKNEQGQFVYFGMTSFEIAGDPKMHVDPALQPRSAGDDPLVKSSLGFMERTLERQERELAESRNRPAPAPHSNLADMQMLLRPMQDTIARLETALAAKDEQLLKFVVDGKKEDPVQAKLLDKLIDGDSARVNAVREQLMSELRMVKENAREDEKRLRDQFDRDLKQAELRHQREVDNLRASHDREMVALKMAADTSKEVLNAEVRRYNADNGDLRTEVKILREKKDQSLLDKAKEVEALKEILGTGGDEAEKSTIEKIADTVLGSEKVFDFAGRWFGPKPATQQAPAQQQMQQPQQQPRFVRQRSTGQVYERQANGEYAPARRRGRGRPNGAGGPAAEQENEDGTVDVHIDPEDVAKATMFLELAFKNGIDMGVLVTSARTQIPDAIMTAVTELGVDGFMAKVAKIPASSPLASLAGRNWLKKFGKALLGDGT